MKFLAAAFVVILAAGACASPPPSTSPQLPTAGPPSSPSGTLPPVTPSPTAAPPAETISCTPDRGPLPSALQGDPCPSAIAAVRAVVASSGLTIARIVLEPGTFDCGVLWPGVQSPVMCFGPLMLPGTTMYGWVSFVGTDKIAAVVLHRPYPQPGSSPAPGPAWTATIAAFTVPPAGWVMP